MVRRKKRGGRGKKDHPNSSLYYILPLLSFSRFTNTFRAAVPFFSVVKGLKCRSTAWFESVECFCPEIFVSLKHKFIVHSRVQLRFNIFKWMAYFVSTYMRNKRGNKLFKILVLYFFRRTTITSIAYLEHHTYPRFQGITNSLIETLIRSQSDWFKLLLYSIHGYWLDLDRMINVIAFLHTSSDVIQFNQELISI